MKFVKLACILALATAGAAYAKGDRTEAEAKARAAVMQTIGAQTKVLGDMAGGKVPFDAAAAEAAKLALSEAASNIPMAFEVQGAEDPASEAKADIWNNWEDFVTKANALKTAAEGVDASSLDGVKAGMGAIGGSCKACHSDYRM